MISDNIRTHIKHMRICCFILQSRDCSLQALHMECVYKVVVHCLSKVSGLRLKGPPYH